MKREDLTPGLLALLKASTPEEFNTLSAREQLEAYRVRRESSTSRLRRAIPVMLVSTLVFLSIALIVERSRDEQQVVVQRPGKTKGREHDIEHYGAAPTYGPLPTDAPPKETREAVPDVVRPEPITPTVVPPAKQERKAPGLEGTARERPIRYKSVTLVGTVEEISTQGPTLLYNFTATMSRPTRDTVPWWRVNGVVIATNAGEVKGRCGFRPCWGDIEYHPEDGTCSFTMSPKDQELGYDDSPMNDTGLSRLLDRSMGPLNVRVKAEVKPEKLPQFFSEEVSTMSATGERHRYRWSGFAVVEREY